MAENTEANLNEFVQEVSLQDLKLQLDSLIAAVDLNRRQLEHMLVTQAQQQSLYEQSVQAVQLQTQILREIQQWKNQAAAQLSDMEMNLNVVDEAVREIQQGMQNMPHELQNIQTAISNIRIYRQEY